MDSINKRETFSSGIAVFFATLGSAVGLGNIWKFPYLTGKNGGGAFVITYLLCVLIIGIPVMVSEFYIGRKSRKNAVGAIDMLKAHPSWKAIGFMGMAAAFFIMFFYSSVAGWVYSYVFKAIKGDFLTLSSQNINEAAKSAGAQFLKVSGNPISPVIWQFIVMLVVSLILIAGVKKGIERITKTLMPVLFVLIIICVARALTLKGAASGIEFLFHIDFGKLNGTVILSALGLAFFKLSLGMGTMITYSSYFIKDTNLINTSVRVAVSDTLVSLLAGLAVFPVVFTFKLEPSGGPGLLFNTIPLVFSRLPFGNILLISFFILASIAATTAMISLVEVPVAYMCDEKGIKRSSAVLITSGIIFIVGMLTVHPQSFFGGMVIMGRSFFDWFDYFSSNLLLPLGGLLIAVFVGYWVKNSEFTSELTNYGAIKNMKPAKAFRFILRYITPILLILVFLNSIGIIKF